MCLRDVNKLASGVYLECIFGMYLPTDAHVPSSPRLSEVMYLTFEPLISLFVYCIL